MAQFDVHRNTGRHKESIPFVVIVQSSQFDDYQRRVVVPLVKAAAIRNPAFEAFNPTFRIRGLAVVLHPLDVVSVPVDALGPKVASLRDHGEQVIAAIDELFSRAWS